MKALLTMAAAGDTRSQGLIPLLHGRHDPARSRPFTYPWLQDYAGIG